ncbi:MAG TPA: exodeoxyribonuclease VII large subunit, partial [Caulobacter sp.]|nr:exodeoxyribonuclease VII large subunit [Caulobacter sp.]
AQVASPLRPTLLRGRSESARARIEELGLRLDSAFARSVDTAPYRQRLADAGRRMANCLRKAVDDRRQRLNSLDAERRLANAMAAGLDRRGRSLDSLEKLRQSFDPKRPLRMGFALVTRPDGSLVRQGAGLQAGETVGLMFDDATRRAVIDGDGGRPAPKPAAKRPASPPAQQGDLF